jgi:hypothetical protein
LHAIQVPALVFLSVLFSAPRLALADLPQARQIQFTDGREPPAARFSAHCAAQIRFASIDPVELPNIHSYAIDGADK